MTLWMTGEILRTYSTASLPLELDQQGGRPTLRFKDVCKRDLKAGNINLAGREALAADRSHWRLAVKAGTQACEERREEQWDERRERRRLRAASTPTEPSTEFICNNCNQACRSRIGLYSHSRRCNSTTD